jgi:hypothetical protein
MNAAEVTDKLGLHSLRQRAWVSDIAHRRHPVKHLTLFLVYSIHLRYLW